MTGRSADAVLPIYEAWNRRDSAAAAALLDAGAEYVNPPYAVEPGIRTGRDAFRRAMEGMLSSFESIHYTIDDVREAGDRVLVTATFTASGAISGVEVNATRHHVWTLREGRPWRFEWFESHAEAIEAAGIPEDASESPANA
jgi:ketosteroid isomerase-like protein